MICTKTGKTIKQSGTFLSQQAVTLLQLKKLAMKALVFLTCNDLCTMKHDECNNISHR